MLLIDATNLSAGGGGVLLTYLHQKITAPHLVLVSPRVGLKDSETVKNVSCGNPLGKARQELLEQFVEDYKPEVVLFFGNLPSLRKLDVPKTYTYFHNAHLIKSLDQRCRYSVKDRLRYFLIRRFIQRKLSHSDEWIFQTNAIRDAFIKEYGTVAISDTHVFPYFDDVQLYAMCADVEQSADREGYVYLSDARPHKNHRRLLQAWGHVIDKEGQAPKLHLTIDQGCSELVDLISAINSKGGNVINHGPLPHSEALKLVAQCEVTVFPSLLETLGLGLVEGALLGTKVICSNDGTLKEVITASDDFDPMSIEQIARSIAVPPEKLDLPEVRLSNDIDGLVAMLTS